MKKRSGSKSRSLGLVGLVLFLGLLAGGRWVSSLDARVEARGAPDPAAPAPTPSQEPGASERPDFGERPANIADGGAAVLRQAFEERRSGFSVQGVGSVARTLADDLEGARHQRFVLRLSDGHTLLFAHNVDLAPRVPLAVGDEIGFRGRYEWNEEGGVVHWTHHDPRGRQPGGWLERQGRRYE